MSVLVCVVLALAFWPSLRREDPVPPRCATLSAYLTRAEWQLAFAPSYAHQLFEVVRPFDSLAEELRYAVRYLAENGLEFETVRVEADGRIVPTQDEPVCPENAALVAEILRGGAPDYEAQLAEAIPFAEDAAPHLRGHIELLVEALAEVRATLEEGQRALRIARLEGLDLHLESA